MIIWYLINKNGFLKSDKSGWYYNRKVQDKNFVNSNENKIKKVLNSLEISFGLDI